MQGRTTSISLVITLLHAAPSFHRVMVLPEAPDRVVSELGCRLFRKERY